MDRADRRYHVLRQRGFRSCAERHAPGGARGAYLRSYAYHFIEQFAPALTRAEIDAALSADAPQD